METPVRPVEPKTDPRLREQVRAIIEGRWGKRNAINSPDINKQCGSVDSDEAGNPKIRAAVRDLIIIEDMPIGSAGPNGFYLIETNHEHEGELHSLRHREEEIRRRRNALERAVQKEETIR